MRAKVLLVVLAGGRLPVKAVPVRVRYPALTGIACAAFALTFPLAMVAAEQPVRIPAVDAVLDRNSDGFQDVIVAGRAVHHDLDGDGRFD
jgi:hypothetical protein